MNIIIQNNVDESFVIDYDVYNISFSGIKMDSTQKTLFANFDIVLKDYIVIELVFPFHISDDELDMTELLYEDIPTRGLIDCGIPLVMAVTPFSKEYQEHGKYTIYCEDMRNTEENICIYKLIFGFTQFLQIMCILESILHKSSLEYNKADHLLGTDNSRAITMEFMDNFKTVGFFVPKKNKIIGFKGCTGFAKVLFTVKDENYSVIVSVNISARNYKRLNKRLQVNNLAKLKNSLNTDNNFYVLDRIPFEYIINKSHNTILEKQCLVGYNESTGDIVYFIFASPSYREFLKSIHNSIIEK